MEWDLDSCMKAFDERRLREWIEAYLQVPEWKNAGLLRRVREYSVVWPGPELLSISDFDLVAGPGPEFKFSQDPEQWAMQVGAIASKLPRPSDLPPVIAWKDPDGTLNLADGHHRVAALEQLGFTQVWALVHETPLRGEEEMLERLAKMENPTGVPKVNEKLVEVSAQFTDFAEYCVDSSELYGYLTNRIAKDEELLAIASHCQSGQPIPNLVFGVVHYMLSASKTDPLTRYYPSITLNPESPELIYPSFKKFVISHSEQIIEMLQTRLVQTNEVLRSAFLYPGFLTAHRLFADRPLSLIEIGPSAGFNLLWDQYLYQYEGSDPVGLVGSSLTLASSFRGDRRPDFSGPMPTVSRRVGIDLHPIDLMDRDEIQWLQALIWPEHFERKMRLNKAVRIAMVNPIEMIQGDALKLLPQVLADVPATDVAAVYHTFVANQFSEEQRQTLLKIIEDYGTKRDIIHIHNCIEPHLHATIFRGGERIDIPLAIGDPHARWIEWLA